MRINENYLKLQDNYLFLTVANKVRDYARENPDKRVIRLGIGDVTLPLCPAVIEAMRSAVCDMGRAETFKGYGPDQGYDFLRQAIRGYYADRGVVLDEDEVFVGDGAKSDVGNILDIFAKDNRVLVPDPVYPVYVDTNVMDGREIVYIDGNAQNGFLPMPDPDIDADIIYLCSPNNPTGAVYTEQGLRRWVDYARGRGAVILFDAAYESFISDASLPHSIFEIDGADECAIEFCSFSKTAGFTGTRCGYTVVPRKLSRGGASINRLWARRQATKFNGVSYVVQRGAAAALSPEGRAQTAEAIGYYMQNARVIADALGEMGVRYTGGENAPYIWMACPQGLTSWGLFDKLLEKAQVVGTPGSGFGKNGEGYFRLTAFGNREDTQEAMHRIRAML